MARQISMMNETQKVKSKKGKVIQTAEKTPAGSLQPFVKEEQKKKGEEEAKQPSSARQAFRQYVAKNLGMQSATPALPGRSMDPATQKLYDLARGGKTQKSGGRDSTDLLRSLAKQSIKPYDVSDAVREYKMTGVTKDGRDQSIGNAREDVEILQGEPKNLTREGQWAARHPYAGTAMYGVANMVGGGEGFVNTAEAALRALASGEKMDPNAIKAAPIAQAYRTGAAQGFREGLQNGITKPIAEAAGIDSDDGRYSKGEKAMDFLTGVGADSVSSAIGMATGGGLSTILMGANAANQSLYDTAADEKTSAKQALALATANGVAEAFFEHFSIENFEAMRIMNPTSAGEYVKAALKSAGIEASEETFTEIANILSDIAIRRDNSELGREYQSYLEEGQNENEAATNTMRSALRQIGLASLGGALSGGLHTGMVMGANTLQGGSQMRSDARRNSTFLSDLAEGIDTSTSEGQRVQDLANAIAEREARGQRAGAAEYGYLNNAVENAMEAGMRSEQQISEAEERDFENEEMALPPGGQALESEKVRTGAEKADAETRETGGPPARTDFESEKSSNDAKNEAQGTDAPGGRADSSLYEIARQQSEEREAERQALRAAAREGNINVSEAMMQQGTLSEAERAEAIRAGSGESLIADLSKGYDTAGAAAFVDNYNGGNLGAYTRAFSQAYNSARAGMKRSDLGAYSSMLTKTQLDAAWKAGASDGAKANEDLLKSMESYKARQENHTGGLSLELSIPNVKAEHGKLSRILDELGKKTGIMFVITDGSKYKNTMLGDSGAVGGYRNGVVAVDISSKNPLATVSHEMTHWLKEYSPFGYGFFRDSAVQSLLRNEDFDFEGNLEQYRKTYPDLSREELIEEMVSDSTGTFLNDEAFVQEVVSGNRSVGQRILDWLNAVCDAIRELISTKSLTKAAYAMKKDLDTWEQTRKIWMEAIEDASENMTSGDREGSSETRWQKIQDEYESSADVRVKNYIDDIIAGKDVPPKIILSNTIPEKVAGEISKIVGFDISAFKNVMRRDEAQHILNRHGANGEQDNSMEDSSHIARISYVIQNYDSVEYGGPSVGFAQPGVKGTEPAATVLIKKQIGENEFYVVEAVPNSKKHEMYVVTAYRKNIKASNQTGRSVNGPAPHVRNASGTDASKDIIRQKKGEVNEAIPVKHQFDMSEPVEQTKDLIAVHNMTVDKLKKALEYEGLPMPSIAITKADLGHENFGGISLVFKKDTIDPKNKKNKVYSADAWTPTFPSIQYQVNEKAETRIRDKFYSLQDRFGRDVADPLYGYGNVLEDQMNRYGGASGILEKEAENSRMVQAYLYDVGRGEEIPKTETIEKETREPISEKSIELGNYIIDKVGREAFENGTVKLRDIRAAYEQRLAEKEGMTEEEAKAEASKRSSLFYTKLGKITKSVLKGETETVRKTTETDATKKNEFLKKEMKSDGYEKWLEDLFEGVEKGKGIYNGKDFYTNSGSRRSFKATHYDVSAANIVKAMLAQNGGSSQNAGGFTAGIKSVRSSAAERFRSIAEIKKASRVLKSTESEVYQEMLEGLGTRLYDTIYGLKKDKNSFFESDTIGEILIEAIEKKMTSPDTLKKCYTQYGYTLTDKQAEEFSSLISDVKEMPVNMFEAKPERVVAWDEVAAAVLPDTAPAELAGALKERGAQEIRFYEEGNEAERKEIIAGMKGVRFQKNIDEEAELTRRTIITWNPDLNHAVKELSGLLTAYKALAPTEEEIKRNTRAIVKKFGSSVNVDNTARQIESLYQYLANGGRADGREVMETAMDIANDILDEATYSDPDVEKRWQAFKKEMRKRRIYVPKDRVNDLNPDGLKALRKQWHGKMLFTTDEKYRERYGNIQYQELQQLFPEYFTAPAEDFANDIDAIQEIMYAFEAQAPVYEKIYEGATREEAATELSYDIMQGYFANEKGQQRFKRIYRDYVKPIRDRAVADYREKLREIQLKDAAAIEQRSIFDQVRGVPGAYIVNEKALKDVDMQGRRAMMERLREKSEKDKARYKEQLEKAKAGYIDREEKERLLRLGRELQKMKGGKEFEQKKQELIGNLDLVARGLSSGLELRLEDQRKEYERLQETDPTFEPDRATLKAFERLDKRQINSLNSHEVRELIQAILKAREDQWNHNRLIREQDSILVSDMGKKVISETRAQRGVKTGTIGDKIDGYNLAHLNSKRAFRKMSGYNDDSGLMSLWHELNEGQHKQMDFRRRSEAPFDAFMKDPENKEFIKGMFKPTVEVTSSRIETKDKNGRVTGIWEPETVKITPAMRVSIYLHSLNQDNREHIAYGGLRIPNMGLYSKGKYADAYGQGAKVLRFNKADLQKIVDSMTPQEMKLADLAWQFFNETSKQAINETSMLLDGYDKAIVDNYMPIKTDTNFTKRDMTGLMQDGTIEGMGSLKERNMYAKNPILLEDVTQVLERSMDNTGRYYGLAVPVRNFNKVYNFQRSGYSDSVKEAILQTFGRKGNQYIEKLLRDIQGGNTSTKDNAGELVDRFTAGLRGNYAGAVLALNPSVAMKQAASYPTAAARLGFGPIVKGLSKLATGTEEDMDLINQYTPLLWYRTLGQSSDALAEVAKRKATWKYNGGVEKARQAFNWIQNIDVKTVKTLWYASEFFVQDSMKDLEKGSEDYYRAVANVFNEVVEDTQPNYTVMQRASISRTDNEIMKSVFMFKTQPLQNLGILYDSIMNYQAKKDAYKKLSDDAAPSVKEDCYREMAAARQGMARSISSIAVSTAIFSAMTTAAALLLHRMDPFRDPDTGELTTGSMLKKYFQNMAESLSGMMLGAGELYSLIMATATGSYLDDFSVSGIDSLNDTISKMYNLFQTVGKAVQDEDKSFIEKAHTADKAAGQLALKLSEMTGIPVNNVKKIAESIMNYHSDIVNGTLKNFESGAKLTKQQNAARAIEAYREGNIEKGDVALEETNKAALEKALGRKITKNLYDSFLEDGENLHAYLNLDKERVPKLSDVPDRGYSSFTKLREGIGDPKRTQNWHHIVEQEQMNEDLSGFKSTQVNNVNNIVSVPSGSKSPHSAISKYYDSVQDFTDGKTVREWLAGKSFEEQFEFGMNQLREYGDLLPTENGWVFVPDDEKIAEKLPMRKGNASEKTETQLKWESTLAEAREDGSLTDREIRESALLMLTEGVSAEEAVELYRSRKKNDKYLDAWKGSFEDYVAGRNAIDDAKQIQDKDKKRQAEKRKKAVQEYLRKYHGKKEDELMLWKLAGYSENSFEYK